jgi:glucose/arabinose dehydrogenase
MRTLPILAVALALVACGNKESSSGAGNTVPGRPVEDRPPNGRTQKPIFPGQTRAPFRTAGVRFDVRTVARGLEHPWSMAFLPDGAMLVTERPGRLRMVGADGTLSQPIAGLPEVDARDQGGLLEVALDPTFADSGRIYFTYAEPRDGGNGTALASARLVREGGAARLEGARVIWRQEPTIDSTKHFGGRLVVGNGGELFVTTGERFLPESRVKAQDEESGIGKVVRALPAPPVIWSRGHRNVQSAAINPKTGALWVVEHGARGGDEINLVERGNNYGWPVITYGIDYSGEPIGQGITAAAGMVQPLYFWDPSIAPSGMAFYDGDRFPAWRGSLFVGALAGKHLARLTLEGTRVVGEERLLVDRARIRDVRVGPSGTIFVLTDEDDGEVLELVPAGG